MASLDRSADAGLQVVGHAVDRVDAIEKVSGEAMYGADVSFEGSLLYGKTLRSPHPHAEIVRLDTSKAEALSGVRAVITFHDVPEQPIEEGDSSDPSRPVAPVYALGRVVRYVGDEVAAVAADSLEIAEQALGLIDVEYKVLPFGVAPWAH